MSVLPATLALVFDFDDTLVPDSTTKLLQAHGIDTEQFWTKDVKALVEDGFDPALAYLTLVLDNIGSDKPLGALTNDGLRRFGETLDKDFYPGLPELFDDLRAIVGGFKHIDIEFYIISGGLQALIEGSTIVRKHFAGVYGCQLSGRSSSALAAIKRCVSFTEKTRYLFEINKGIGKIFKGVSKRGLKRDRLVVSACERPLGAYMHSADFARRQNVRYGSRPTSSLRSRVNKLTERTHETCHDPRVAGTDVGQLSVLPTSSEISNAFKRLAWIATGPRLPQCHAWRDGRFASSLRLP